MPQWSPEWAVVVFETQRVFYFSQIYNCSNGKNVATYYALWSQPSIMDQGHLRNECLFFSVHGIWIAVRNKQIAWTAKRFSCDLFVPHCDSYPMNREKKDTHSLYLQCLQQRPLLNSPSKVRNSNFPQKSGTWPYFQIRRLSLTPSAKIVRG